MVIQQAPGSIRVMIRCFAVAMLLWFVPAATPSFAQQQAAAAPAASPQSLVETQARLQALIEERGLTEERTKALAEEVQKIRKDHASLTAALIQAAKTEKKLAGDVLELEGQLADLEQQSAGIRDSLNGRRALLAEVLAGLQRMGLNPPPAILVKPEDALSSVRSSILLSAVVPGMRNETEVLISDLRELSNLGESIIAERDRLNETRAAQTEEQARLSLLLEEKRKLEEERRQALDAEQQKLASLAQEAGSMEELIASIREEMEEAARRAEAEREAEAAARAKALAEAEEARRQKQFALEEAKRQEIAALDAARQRAEELEAQRPRLKPGTPFEKLTRTLAKPVVGRTITAFGDNDGFGTNARGDTVSAEPGSTVTAPADATVLYAGPFRAYGQLLILDVGSDYHVVLAGMDNLDVSTGQIVLAGEPVGTMGSVRLASVTTAATDNDNPTLYIEFRKNGKPVDPSPWWENLAAGRT